MHCAHRRLDIVLMALASVSVPSIGSAQPSGESLLRAVQRMENALVAELLDAGASPNAADSTGGALHYAAATGNVDAARLLLAAGANRDGLDANGATPLIIAVITNQSEAATFMIEQGAELEVIDQRGLTALDAAIIRSNIDVIGDLFDAGVSMLRYPVDGTDDSDVHPIVHAMQSSTPQVFELIYARDEDRLMGSHLITDMLTIAILEAPDWATVLVGKADLDQLDSDGYTPLYHATAESNLPLIKEMVEAGADVNARSGISPTDIGEPPIFAAINYAERADIVAYLIEAGADVNATSPDGYRPLHFAAARLENDIARLLLEAGANVNAENDLGHTPLSIAATSSMRELMLEHGAQP